MGELDMEQVAILMRERRQRAEAFRQRHEATFPALFDADDHYWRGGSKEPLIREIESGCQERPDLAGEIRDIWRWIEVDEVKEGFIAV